MFDGMEMGIFPLIASPALRTMAAQAHANSPAEITTFVQSWMGTITALFLLGAALGGLIFGWLGDRIGRVRAMTWSILAYSLLTGLCILATQPWHLAAFRFLAALGMGGEWALGVALVMESWPERRRPWLASAIGVSANLGYSLIATIGLLAPITEQSWRWIMLVGATPAALTVLIRLFVPESQKWIQSRSQPESKIPPTREIFQPHLRRTTSLAILFASIPLLVTWGIVQWIPLWGDELVRQAGQHNDKAKAYCQLFSSLGASTGSLLAPLAGHLLGRRPAYFLLCAASLASGSVLFRAFHQFTPAFLAAVFLTGACSASFYGWLPLYLPELFPTRARATGQGLAYNFGRILAAAGAWNMPALMGFFDRSYPKAGATLVLVYLIGMITIWFAPETRNKPLPD